MILSDGLDGVEDCVEEGAAESRFERGGLVSVYLRAIRTDDGY